MNYQDLDTGNDGDDMADLMNAMGKTSFNAFQLKNECRLSKNGKSKKKKIIKVKKANKEDIPSPKDLNWKEINQQVLVELNKVRVNPKSLIPRLEFIIQHMRNNAYFPPKSKIGINYKEGKRVIQETIDFLRKQPKRKPLRLCNELSKAASLHVQDQGASGKTGHIGDNELKPAERMSIVGEDEGLNWKGCCGENIMYGRETGRDIVCALIIDDGVKSRGHRINMFSEDWGIVGIASGPHPKFRTMCVLDFAGDYGE